MCRPISGGLIADVFSPNARALANGVFSWGVYFGYGLAYVIGINLTSAGIQMLLLQIKHYFPLLPREALYLLHFDLLNMLFYFGQTFWVMVGGLLT